MDNHVLLGKSLKYWREASNLTQNSLAHETGIHQCMISRWEAGINLPSIVDLITLADFYKITLDELVGRKEY